MSTEEALGLNNEYWSCDIDLSNVLNDNTLLRVIAK